MTRAEEGLFLSGVEGRLHDGAPRYMSRFLLDIDPGLLTYDREPRAELVADSRRYAEVQDRLLAAQSGRPPFSIGDRVRHAVMGFGVIEDVDEKKNAWIVRFVNLGTPRAISFRAKLERAEED
jgi:DNA helicase-2/ATP-dependent DNA helicase PcrA